MAEFVPARLLQAHITEQDRWQGRPLHEAIVEKCRELHIAGATVFRGLEGYGDSAEIHRRRGLPVIVTVVDSAEAIARLAPALEEMMDKGVIAVWDVRMRRVTR